MGVAFPPRWKKVPNSYFTNLREGESIKKFIKQSIHGDDLNMIQRVKRFIALADV